MTPLLVALIYLTSVGFTVDMHYCKGELKSFNFIGKAKSCHEMTTKVCPHHQKLMADSDGEEIDMKNCCANKVLHFQSDEDKVFQSIDFQETQLLPQFLVAFVAAFFSTEATSKEVADFALYKPPIISRDISVLFQSLLI